MGLIDAIKRFFAPWPSLDEPGPSVAELVRENLPLLEQAIGTAAYELREEDSGRCHVVTDGFTLTFSWDWRDRWLTAGIRLHQPPHVPLEFDFDFPHDVRSWLAASGASVPARRADCRSPALMRDEIAMVRLAVAQIFFDEGTIREAVFYLAGKIEGYNDVGVIPEDLPPGPVIDWTRRRLLESGRPTRDPRDPPPGLD